MERLTDKGPISHTVALGGVKRIELAVRPLEVEGPTPVSPARSIAHDPPSS